MQSLIYRKIKPNERVKELEIKVKTVVNCS